MRISDGMESNIRSILVPTDFSAASQRAVDYARVLAAALGRIGSSGPRAGSTAFSASRVGRSGGRGRGPSRSSVSGFEIEARRDRSDLRSDPGARHDRGARRRAWVRDCQGGGGLRRGLDRHGHARPERPAAPGARQRGRACHPSCTLSRSGSPRQRDPNDTGSGRTGDRAGCLNPPSRCARCGILSPLI